MTKTIYEHRKDRSNYDKIVTAIGLVKESEDDISTERLIQMVIDMTGCSHRTVIETMMELGDEP